MKTTSKLLSALVLAALFMVGCSEDESNDPAQVDFSFENSARTAQADNIVEGTFTIMETAYHENEEPRMVSFFPECVIITISPNGNGGTIELDFGEGCQLNNGAMASGVIFMEYGPIVEGTRAIDYSFDNYFYNGNGVSGGGEIFREISNNNGNPQSTINETIEVSFPNTSVTATRNGLRIAEWIEGFGSGNWADNTFSITGNWDTTLSNGFGRTGTVTEALIREMDCLYLVEGTLQIEQQNITGILDFGDGNCDNSATLTINGENYNIEL